MRMILTWALFLAALATAPAGAADNPMQQCGARYKAAKIARTLPAGQTWPQFLATCRASLAKAPATPVSAPGKAMTAALAKPAAGEPSAAQAAARQRQKQCAANYQADKSAGKLGGKSWPQYYSGCSAKLKG